MNIVIWFFVIIALIILVNYATTKLINNDIAQESFGNSVIDNDIILTYAEILQRQPSTKELIEQGRNINGGLITMNDLRQRLITSDEYQRLKKLQSNELSPELPRVIEDANIMNKVSKLYEAELLIDIPSNILLPLKDIYIYLGYNDKSFRAMLRSKNYDNFENDLQYSYNNNLNYEMTMSLFLNYFDPATLKAVGFTISDNAPNGAAVSDKLNRTIEDRDGNSTNLLSQIDTIANGIFDINQAAKNLKTPTNKVKLFKEKPRKDKSGKILDVDNLTAGDADMITPQMLASYNNKELQSLTPDLLFQLLQSKPQVFEKLSPQQVLAFSPSQINQIANIVSAIFGNSGKLVSDLSSEYIASLPLFEVRVLPIDILNQFSKEQIAAFTTMQIFVLSQQQKDALQITHNLTKLPDELKAGFSPSTLENNFNFHFKPLTPTQLDVLTPAEILGLPDDQKALFTNDQMKNEVNNRSFDYTSRPPAQVNLDQLYHYTGTGSGHIYTGFGNNKGHDHAHAHGSSLTGLQGMGSSLNPATAKSQKINASTLTAAQIAALTPDQISSLTVQQILQIDPAVFSAFTADHRKLFTSAQNHAFLLNEINRKIPDVTSGHADQYIKLTHEQHKIDNQIHAIGSGAPQAHQNNTQPISHGSSHGSSDTHHSYGPSPPPAHGSPYHAPAPPLAHGSPYHAPAPPPAHGSPYHAPIPPPPPAHGSPYHAPPPSPAQNHPPPPPQNHPPSPAHGSPYHAPVPPLPQNAKR